MSLNSSIARKTAQLVWAFFRVKQNHRLCNDHAWCYVLLDLNSTTDRQNAQKRKIHFTKTKNGVTVQTQQTKTNKFTRSKLCDANEFHPKNQKNCSVKRHKKLTNGIYLVALCAAASGCEITPLCPATILSTAGAPSQPTINQANTPLY